MFRPFKNLDKLLGSRTVPHRAVGSHHPDGSRKGGSGPDSVEDDRLFKEAMEGVIPIVHDKLGAADPVRNIAKPAMSVEPRCDTVRRLEQLVKGGKGFVVADTPEYIEGVGPRVHPGVTKYLHAGRFSIQAYIDLHGMTVTEARSALNDFLKEATTTGKRAVSIVHGRGLSSPREPVLKAKVHHWLTTGIWRKWVIAFSSARACDGGAGATYVLLRQRPLTKRFWKNGMGPK